MADQELINGGKRVNEHYVTSAVEGMKAISPVTGDNTSSVEGDQVARIREERAAHLAAVKAGAFRG